MNLEHYYWYFESALSTKMCDEILNYGKRQQSEIAVTGGILRDKGYGELTKQEIKNIQKKRKSEVVWLDDRWIFKEIHPYIHMANEKAGWNFDWNVSETAQFTKYGPGQYYGWHCDSWDKAYNDPKNENKHGKIRKLSVTISLSDPNDYEGGNLEFDFRNQVDWENNKEYAIHKCKEIRPRGSIIVFPSFVWHRVSPVTKGTRYSLVVWNLGKPFR